MKTMRAAVARRFGQPLAIEELPVPEVGPHDILDQVMATGVFHTDLHAVSGDWPVTPTLPFVPSHEGAGVVVAAGGDVRHARDGDRVGVPWLHAACARCEFCLTGWETLCDHQTNTGYGVNGTFADYVLADPDYVAPLPPHTSFNEMTPILCADVTVYKGLRVLDCKPGDWVVISGIGGLGHLAVQYAKAMGLHVVAVDVTPDKLAFALGLGADITVDAMAPDAVEGVRRIDGGALVTAVSRPAFAQALAMAHKRGTISLVGRPPGDFPLPIFDVVLNAKTARGSIVGSRMDLQEALRFAADGAVRTVYCLDALEHVNDVFARMLNNEIEGRVVLRLQE